MYTATYNHKDGLGERETNMHMYKYIHRYINYYHVMYYVKFRRLAGWFVVFAYGKDR